MPRFLRLLQIIFISCILLTANPPAVAQNVASDAFQTEIHSIPANKVSIYIEDLRNGRVVLDVNGEEPLVPASVTKVVTAATVTHKRWLDRNYTTRVVTTGRIDKNGVLDGNIKILACGDPTIESAYFTSYNGLADSIAVAAQRKGITSIKGKIVIDQPKWLCEGIPSGWVKEDVNYPYGADHHAVNYADNKFTLTYRKQGDYSLSPAAPDVEIKTGNGKNGASRLPGERSYTVCHSGRKPLTTTLANPCPESSLRYDIENKLAQKGINIDGLETKASGESDLYLHKSPKASEILKSLITRSDNQMAEAMLRFAWPDCPRAIAAKRELETWKELGVNMNDVVLEDGSGLSRNNRLTAYALADLLVWMRDKEPDFPRFLNMFPRAGQTGTLKSFLVGTPLEGKLWAKTGSMSGVQSYAGYVVDDSGRPTHVVVILVNGFKCDRGKIKSGITDMLIKYLFPTEN